MKSNSKNISKTVLLLFMTILGSSFAKAQTHVKGATNCILHDAYLKEASKTKNSVSCVDCYCKVCGDKKEKAKQAKLKAEETASKQKTATPQKKTTTATTTKTKSDEVILVAPKPKVEKNTTVKLSVQDKKIFDIYNNRKDNEKLIVAYCDGDCLVKLQYPEVVTNSGRIFLRQNSSNKYIFTVLKDNFNLNSKLSYTSYEGELSEEFKDFGLMIIRFVGNSGIYWDDIVDLNGNCVFGNTENYLIKYYKDTKTFKLEKQGTGRHGAGKFTEEYNPITNKITPIQ